MTSIFHFLTRNDIFFPTCCSLSFPPLPSSLFFPLLLFPCLHDQLCFWCLSSSSSLHPVAENSVVASRLGQGRRTNSSQLGQASREGKQSNVVIKRSRHSSSKINRFPLNELWLADLLGCLTDWLQQPILLSGGNSFHFLAPNRDARSDHSQF